MYVQEMKPVQIAMLLWYRFWKRKLLAIQEMLRDLELQSSIYRQFSKNSILPVDRAAALVITHAEDALIAAP